MSNQNLEQVDKIKSFFENMNMYRNEVESFVRRYPLNERCLIARINSVTFRVEIFYIGQVLDKNKTTENTRIKLLDVVDPETGNSKDHHKKHSVLQLMPNNVDKPWVYAYITFKNLNKLLNATTPLARSTSTPYFFPTQQSLNTNQTKKRKVEPVLQEKEDLIFDPNVFDDGDTALSLPIIADTPSSKKGGKRKPTKKRKPKKRKSVKKNKK